MVIRVVIVCHQRHSYFQAAAKRSARLVRMYSAIDRSSAESAHQEMGVAAISKRLHEGVTQYHAQIGASVPMAQLLDFIATSGFHAAEAPGMPSRPATRL